MSRHLIPESVVDVVLQELQNVNAVSQQYLQQNILRVLQDKGINNGCIDSVMNAVNVSDLIKKCLDEGGVLHRSHKRLSHIVKNFNYVQPESVYVGRGC